MASFWAFIKQQGFKPLRLASIPRRYAVSACVFTLLGAACLYGMLWKLSTRASYLHPIAGGTLTEGVVGAPRFIHPLLAANPTDEALVALIYSGLVRQNTDGSIAGDLATFSLSSDQTVYTFTIKDHAVFSDNKPVTADDVLFTYGLVQQGLGPSAIGNAVHAMTFEKIDDQTIAITVPGGTPEIFHALSLGILPQHLWGNITAAAMRDAPEVLQPIGSGPFKLAHIVSKNDIPTDIVLKRNTRALTVPRLKKYDLAIYANEADIVSALEKGAIDFVGALHNVPPALAAADSAYQIKTADTPATFSLYALPSSQLFSDSAFRSAFGSAIDRTALIATIEDGYGTALPSAADSSLAPSKTFDDLIANHALSRSESGALLRSGVPIDIAITVESGTKENEIANALRETLAPLGIQIDVRAYDSGTWRGLVESGQVTTVIAHAGALPNGYTLQIPLYQELQPIIIAKKLSFLDTADLTTATFYDSAADWYVREERLWNLFTQKLSD